MGYFLKKEAPPLASLVDTSVGILCLWKNDWVAENRGNIEELLPSDWQEMDQILAIQIGYGIKCMGVDWRSNQDFGDVMTRLIDLKIMELRVAVRNHVRRVMVRRARS